MKEEEKEIEFDYKSFCLTNAAELQKALVSNGMGEGRGEGRGKVGIWHTDAIAKLESFRALKLSRLESFKVLKFTARLESFRALKFSNFERFSALKVTRLVSFRVLRITARLECFRALKLSNPVIKIFEYYKNNLNNLKCILKIRQTFRALKLSNLVTATTYVVGIFMDVFE